MKRIGFGVGVVLCVLASGCQRSHPRNSSGSNWLTCERLSDCSAAAQAVACDADGFCVDEGGSRIPIESNQIAVETDAGTSDAGMTAGQGSELPPGLPGSERCAWGVDALLLQAAASAPGRINCGLYNSGETGVLESAYRCFRDAVAADMAVELTINDCMDCSIPTTYVATPRGLLFAILMEEDNFGDELRQARVQSCDGVALDPETHRLSCTNPLIRYECSELRTLPVSAPEPPPVTPLKLTDAVDAGPSVPLHLFVSNQSFASPLVDISVVIEGRRVVTGDFDVGGQHNWFEFEIAVPPGTLMVQAYSADGNADLNQVIDVPAERWAVLDYWYDGGSPEAEYFTLTVHESAPGFE